MENHFKYQYSQFLQLLYEAKNMDLISTEEKKVFKGII
jgi:hypothetical protein